MRRVQLSRRPGARLPDGCRGVARPSRWSNPFPVSGYGRAEAIRRFRAYAVARLAEEPTWLDPLRDCKALACWCRPDERCHADVLIELIESTKLSR